MRSIILFSLFIALWSGTLEAQITSQTIISKGVGELGNQTTHCAALSGDGRFTIFESFATNLVAGDTNNRSDLFLYDSNDGSVRRLSQNSQGAGQIGGENPTTCSSSISRDGTTVIYATDGVGLVDDAQTNVSRIYAINTVSGAIELLTPGTLSEGAYFPSVNQDGTKIVFVSNDPNLTGANGKFQLYLIDRSNSNLITLLSVDENGAAGDGQSIRGTISHDGQWVAYDSNSSTLKGATLALTSDTYQVFEVNVQTRDHLLVSKNAEGVAGNSDSMGANISADGQRVAFFTSANNLTPADTNANGDVLLYDRSLNSFDLVSVNTEGKRIKGFHELLGNSLSADGNLVMFRALIGSFDKFRIEVYVRDRAQQRTYLSSFSNSCSFGQSGGNSHSGSIAPDVQTLAFAIGKDTKRSPLQMALIDLDVLQFVSAAPTSLDTPDADICQGNAVIAMTPFALASSEIAAARLQASGVTYETQLKRTDIKTDAQRIVSKRNIIALKNLDAGSYSAKYRVTIAATDGKKKSVFSRPVKFRINAN